MTGVSNARRVPVLTAPTASGKTALALRLAEEFPLEVVSADAFLVYRGLDIGTAKPTVEERSRVRHHLIDIREPGEPYDVVQFVQDAERAVEEVLAAGRRPLVVGGTGFYLSALMQGLPTTPRADPAVQAAVEAELAARGLDALLEEIRAVRPQELVRLQRNPRRVVRSLEVYRRTGRFPSEFGRTQPRHAYQLVAFSPPPDVLRERIAARSAQMFAAGLVGEVEGLLRLGMTGTAWQAIGYKEVAAYLRGELSLDGAVEAVVNATVAYARRQLTWLRTQLRADILPGALEAEQELRQLLKGK